MPSHLRQLKPGLKNDCLQYPEGLVSQLYFVGLHTPMETHTAVINAIVVFADIFVRKNTVQLVPKTKEPTPLAVIVLIPNLLIDNSNNLHA